MGEFADHGFVTLLFAFIFMPVVIAATPHNVNSIVLTDVKSAGISSPANQIARPKTDY